MISRLGGVGVPIVSQSKLRPIFCLLMESGARRKQSPMMEAITATAALLIAAAARTLARAEAVRSRRLLPARLSGKRLVLRPRPERAGGDRQAAERHMPVGMNCVGLLLPA